MAIGKMTFAHLRESDLSELRVALRDHSRRENTLEHLVAYLDMWRNAGWIDHEKIFHLGVDIEDITPNEFRGTVRSIIAKNVPTAIAEIFILGYDKGTKSLKPIKSAPSRIEIENIRRSIAKNGLIPSTINTVQALFNRLQDYLSGGGSIDVFLPSLVRISSALLRVPSSQRQQAGRLIHNLVRGQWSMIVSAPRAWTLWSDSLTALGVFEAAELLLWEASRRFPWDIHVRTRLYRILVRTQVSLDDLKVLAKEHHNLFPDSEDVVFQLARSLAQTRAPEDLLEAITLLTHRIASVSKVHFETTFLASLLSHAERNNRLHAESLSIVVSGLRNKQRLLGAITLRLISIHHDWRTAERLWRVRVQQAPSDVFAWNQLARALAASRDRRQLDEAIAILREAAQKFPSEIVTQNHLAKLLAERGTLSDLREAIALLRNAVEVLDESDPYSRNQLAQLLARSGNELERKEAIDLALGTLRFHRDDKAAQQILDVIAAAPLGTAVTFSDSAAIADNELADAEDLASRDDIDDNPSSSIKVTDVLPDNIVFMGQLRRSRFYIENSSPTKRRESLQLVRAALRDNSKSVYAKILAIREGLIDENSLTTFALGLESALRKRDASILDILQDRFPRLAALTIVAKAFLGDSYSAAIIKNLLSGDDVRLHPAVLALKRRLSPHLRLVGPNDLFESTFPTGSDKLLAALRDANEAAISDDELLAA